MPKLADRVALITGGGQGLGKSIALAMAREGANIVLCDINPHTLAEAVSELEAEGAQALGVECDVASVDSVEGMFAQAAERFDTVHILVNNAALIASGPADTEGVTASTPRSPRRWTGNPLALQQVSLTMTGFGFGMSTCMGSSTALAPRFA